MIKISKKVNNLSLKRSVVLTTVFILIIIAAFTSIDKFNRSARAHSALATPIEIFSLWNDSAPLINGLIDFSPVDHTREWSSAAVYNMYDNTNSPTSKLLLQNDDNNLFIGMDVIDHQTFDPPSIWGCAIYLDRDHNGLLSSYDRAVYLNSTISDDLYVSLRQYDETENTWVNIETDLAGEFLPSGIIADTGFGTSYFESISHRQFELKIPLTVIQVHSGNITGIGFEAFQSFDVAGFTITWPGLSSNPQNIKYDSKHWGDINFGINETKTSYYSQYLIEENFNIKSSATGLNNGTYVATGDINGDGDLEIIVSSNRTVTGDNNLVSIFDYVSGELTQIWNSWESTQSSKFFRIKGFATNDFDSNGEDEIYMVGDSPYILKLSGWTGSDFSTAVNCNNNYGQLSGFIDIGDINNDINGDTKEVVVSVASPIRENEKVMILVYNSSGLLEKLESFDPFLIGGSEPAKVLALKIANMDSDAANELSILSQITSDDSIATTRLQILESGGFFYGDNLQDDLPQGSYVTTQDAFGHTIIVDDVDNDGSNETIIVGKNYLKVFGVQTFNDPSPPLVFIINDNSSSPFMGGSATVGDINNDGKNELVFGCNNGTVFIVNITDAGSDSLSYDILWQSDLGTQSGTWNSMEIHDFDDDGENELLLGDNFGQIMILGESNPPEITIDAPDYGKIIADTSIILNWTANDDFYIHHFEIWINSTFECRTGGSQRSYLLNLEEGINNIELIGFDVTGKNDTELTYVDIFLDAPEVTITSPPDNFIIRNSSKVIHYSYYDRNDDFDHYEIWVDGSRLVASTIADSYAISMTSDKLYVITVVAVDSNGNSGNDTITILRDQTPPELDIVTPKANSVVNVTDLEVRWTATDHSGSGLDYYEIRLDTILVATIDDAFSKIIQLNIDKQYIIEVRAFDIAGNLGYKSVTITRDTISPTINITSPTQSPIYISDEYLLIEWSAEDNYAGSGINFTKVTVNGVLDYNGTDSQANITLTGEGYKDVVVTTYDFAGNIAQDYLLVIVDLNAPIITITSPINNYNTSLNSITIEWTCSDIGSGIKEYEIYIDTIFAGSITNPEIKYYTIPLLQYRSYTITIRAIDNYGRQSEASIIINRNDTIKSFNITSPSIDYYYSPTSELIVTWAWMNLINLTGFEIYINNALNFTINDNTTLSYTFDLLTPFDEFLVYNITILAITTNPSIFYRDMFWVQVDQVHPVVSITSPANNSLIHTNVVYIEWVSSDQGTGISLYVLKINDIVEQQWTFVKNSLYLEFNNISSSVKITIEVFDLAMNEGNDSIILEIALLLPEYSLDIDFPYYTNTGTFSFNLDITNTQSGIEGIIILVDNNEIDRRDYSSNIKDSPFSILIQINSTDYTSTEGTHSLTIIICDIFCRQIYQTVNFIVDRHTCEIIGPTTFGNIVLEAASTQPTRIVKSGDTNDNVTISTTISDNIRIYKVFITIVGEDYNTMIEMTKESSGTNQLSDYFITLNISELELGDYSLTITAYDFASNSITESYNITLTSATVIPWILRGNNLLYVSAGSGAALLLIIFLSVASRKVFVNIGWKHEIVTIAYILNGLPCVYMINKPELVKDELLFGGAMTGIRGVLEEITGEKAKMDIQSVEMGKRKVLICPGNYGDSVLMVNKIKPIHKTKLITFTKSFETYYGDLLKDDPLITPDTFRGASILVESHFGLIEKMQLVDECDFEDVSFDDQVAPAEPRYQAVEETTYKEDVIYEEPHPSQKPAIVSDPLVDSVNEIIISEGLAPTAPIVPIEEIVGKMSKIHQTLFLEIIKLTQNAITSLMEKDLEKTTISNNSILERLEVLLKSSGLPDIATPTIRTLLNITQDLFAAIELGKSGNEIAFKNAVEKVSHTWLKEIGEKW